MKKNTKVMEKGDREIQDKIAGNLAVGLILVAG